MFSIKTKLIVTGGLLVCLTVIFQCIPAIFGEFFVLFTILSALPIFIITKINPKAGLAAFIASSLLIFLFSSHEAIMFLFTNGPVGLFLGLYSRYCKNKLIISLIPGLILTLTLIILNYIIGIPVFGTHIPGEMLAQILILGLFSVCYTTVYYFFANLVFSLIDKHYPLNF